MSSKFFVFGAGRWRELDTNSGRLAGWGRAMFVYLNGGRLTMARRCGVLRALRALGNGRGRAARDGLQLSKYVPPPERRKRRRHRSPDPLMQYQEHHTHVMQTCIQCNNNTTFDKLPQLQCSVGVQCVPTAEAGVQSAHTAYATRAPSRAVSAQRAPREDPDAAHVAPSRAKPMPSRTKRGRFVKRIYANGRSISMASANETVADVTKASPGPCTVSAKHDTWSSRQRSLALADSRRKIEDVKELVIDEEDVQLLRRFLTKNQFGVDVRRFDTDERYKERVFYAINPIVLVERCARIGRVLRPPRAPRRQTQARRTRARGDGASDDKENEDNVPLNRAKPAKATGPPPAKRPRRSPGRPVEVIEISESSIESSSSSGGGYGGGGGSDSESGESSGGHSRSRRVIKKEELETLPSTKRSDGAKRTGEAVGGKREGNRSKRLVEGVEDGGKQPGERVSGKREGNRSKRLVEDVKDGGKQPGERVNGKREGNRGTRLAVGVEDGGKRLGESVSGKLKGEGDGDKRPKKQDSGSRRKESGDGKQLGDGARRAGGAGKRNREYTSQEDHAIVSWLRRGERARFVNGNRLWRELQHEHVASTGIARSWHSLRNRYLRYILPALPRLASEQEATRLRAAASAGELKSKKQSRDNSLLALPPVLSAWSRRPAPRLASLTPPAPPAPPAACSTAKPAASARPARTPTYSELTRRFGNARTSSEDEFEAAARSPRRLRTSTRTSARTSTHASARAPGSARSLRAAPTKRRLFNPKAAA